MSMIKNISGYQGEFAYETLTILGSSWFGLQAWKRIIVRKYHTCRVCGKMIRTSEEAYRPITNRGNRWHRICPDCIEKLREPVLSAATPEEASAGAKKFMERYRNAERNQE